MDARGQNHADCWPKAHLRRKLRRVADILAAAILQGLATMRLGIEPESPYAEATSRRFIYTRRLGS